MEKAGKKGDKLTTEGAAKGCLLKTFLYMHDDDAQFMCTCVGSVKSYRRKIIEVSTKMARKVEIKSSPDMREVDDRKSQEKHYYLLSSGLLAVFL